MCSPRCRGGRKKSTNGNRLSPANAFLTPCRELETTLNTTKKPTAAKQSASRSRNCSTAECRDCRKYLRQLVTTVESTLAWIDDEMKKPSNVERGKRIAAYCNNLEMQKDLAKRFGLGVR